MIIFNRLILVGLFFAGISLVAGIYGEGLPEAALRIFLTIGTVSGWLCGFAAVVAFIIATLAHLVGRLPQYWKQLYALNFGIAVFGGTSLGFTSDKLAVWLGVAGLGMASGLLLYLVRSYRWRVLPVLIAAPIFFSNLFHGWHELLQIWGAVCLVVLGALPFYWQRNSMPPTGSSEGAVT